jgi:hypothetical protein
MKASTNSTDESHLDVNRYIQILKDIKTLSSTYHDIKISVKRNFTQIKISNINFTQAEIELEFKDNSWILISHNFPPKAASSLLKINQSSPLSKSVESANLLSNNLNEFYLALETLEKTCSCVEPVNKSPDICWRLIRYNKFLFIKVIFNNPFNIDDFSMEFFGKEKIVNEMKEKYNSLGDYTQSDKMEIDGSDNDDDDLNFTIDEPTIFQKLCKRLKIMYFPTINNQEGMECKICFDLYDDDNRIAMACCENEKCQELFHTSCLAQHLKINVCYKIMSVLNSTCMFCKSKISLNGIGYHSENENVIINE